MTRIITDYSYRETLLNNAYANFFKCFTPLSDYLRSRIDYYFSSLRESTTVHVLIPKFILLEYILKDIVRESGISTLNYETIISGFDLIVEDIYLEEIEKSIQDN